MATLTARSIVDKAKIIVQDNTGVRWPDVELIKWLNDAQRDVVLMKPDACVKNVSVQAVAGTKQTLPNDAIGLIDVPRNMGVNGTTPGRTIRQIPKVVLDGLTADWHTATASAVSLHYVYDKRDPKHFYLYPPQPAVGPGQIEVVYPANPVDCTLASHDGLSTGSPDSVIAIDDVYGGALLDLVLYRAYSKDSKYAGDGSRAVAHRSAALESLGAKEVAESSHEPVAVTNRAE